jgi:NADPH:quinone reductase-like Zn-dependent oxidoreductase
MFDRVGFAVDRAALRREFTDVTFQDFGSSAKRKDWECAKCLRAVQFDSYGGTDVLEVRDVPRPVPGAGEVLVEVRAAGINPSEAVIRSGALHHLFPATFPSGQGSDLAGVVAELGPGVSAFTVGEEVIGFYMRRSSHAEYVSVPANQLTPRPPAVPWEVAGSLFVAGVTA